MENENKNEKPATAPSTTLQDKATKGIKAAQAAPNQATAEPAIKAPDPRRFEQLIFSKIPDIMQQVTHIGKDRKNPQQGYAFRGIDDMYNELHAIFAANRVFFTSRVIHAEREERINKNQTTLVFTILDIKFTFYAEDGSSISSVMRGEAMDSGDKASSKAASTALKYALMQMFMIPTEEDKDTENNTYEVMPKQYQAGPPPRPAAPQQAPAMGDSPRPGYENQGGDERPADIRPWLTEDQYLAMLTAIGEGKGGVVLAKMESYKIRRDYREKLNSAIAAAQSVQA